MNILKSIQHLMMSPIWLVQLATSAKSFLDNPILGSQRLNRMGLHRGRVRLAGAMARWRRLRLAHRVPVAWREAFDRDGFVAIHDVVPPAAFVGLRDAILGYEGPAREMVQGDAVTRRLAIDPAMLQQIPALKALLARADIRALFHYVAGFRIEPLHYVQTIVTHASLQAAGGDDPQEALHADAFHSSLKAWLFLNPVEEGRAPFRFVPGSHRVTKARLDWEYRRSTVPPGTVDRLSARGSPRVVDAELSEMGLPAAMELIVPENTLVVADTFGFHARGASCLPVQRVEIWSYARRNPFLPWIGGDLLSLPGLAERRVRWLWRVRDRFERWTGQPWRPAGNSERGGCGRGVSRRSCPDWKRIQGPVYSGVARPEQCIQLILRSID